MNCKKADITPKTMTKIRKNEEISLNVPAPEFTINPSDIMVKFTAPKDRVVYGPGKVTDGVTDAQRRILDELRIDPGYSYVIIAENLGISKKTVAAHMKKLKEKGFIERVGNNKTGHWEIKE